jgi:CheY-like chemotaxis protein
MIKRILLADDDADDRLMFEEVFSGLSSDHYELHTAINGEEVISFLKSINNPSHLPDLIILDQNMPLMSGKETLEFIKTNPLYREIPVIMYSTYNDANFIKQCEQLGVVSVVSKPDSYEGYILMINNFLKYTARPLV